MQGNNIIYEITRQIQDKDNIQKDFQQAFNLVSDMFKKKYIDKLDLEFKNRLQEIEQNPTKEIRLLTALKPFLENSNHSNLDNTINAIRVFSAINSFKINSNSDFEVSSKEVFCTSKLNEQDSSVKEDGVYDVDEGCLFGVKNTGQSGFSFILLIMIILLFIN